MESLDATLDRMVDALVAHKEIQFLDLVQYVWRLGWSLSAAQKPSDKDALHC